MPAIIVAILRWFVGFAVAKFFVSLAIGVVSYSIIQYFFDKYINLALQQISYMGDVAQLMAIAQLDHAISVVIGALSIKGFMMATKAAIGVRGS
ncbi:DUF2523 family protein [Psychrobacter sp. Cmf 22.2]|uniref:DUF2523 family protein n=1 Tax=Psychrobacter sp. Cmf 22.2 TaxID=1926478 RepID=UPI00094703F9|nr:DUF2523 family protein [Psychrobacter sp. Cmf 22.2]OLF35456.1 hypothetical protein BTV98_13090 [Psychrobacter sp. Cmf 22.2]